MTPKSVLKALALSVSALAACAHDVPPPEIGLDDPVAAPVSLVDPPKPVTVVQVPTVLPLPGQLKPPPRPGIVVPEPADPKARVALANRAARVQPSRYGYINATQVWPYAAGALYQLYASPGKVTDVALQDGEQLVSVSAGDTVRWVIGDTSSGTGAMSRVHILVKPTRPDLRTNLVVNTDRRTYLLELTATELTWMASASWDYPQDQLLALQNQNRRAEAAAPVADGIPLERLHFRYAITGDTPSWRPVRAFDDGEKVYIQFPAGIAQGELPPLFVVGPTGENQLVNYRARALLRRRSPVRRRRTASRRRSPAGGADRAHRRGPARDLRLVTAVPPVGPPPIPPQNKVAPETLALRASPRPVTRLSRRALILLGSVSALTIAGLAIWALGVQHSGGAPPQELYSTDHKPIAEGLGTLPRDYGSLPRPAPPPTVPQLGPPLPGDLGRPFLRAQQEGNGVPILAPAGPSAEEQAALAEKQRLRQEAEAAARGQIFVQVRQRTDAAPQAGTAGTATAPAPPNPFAPLPGSAERERPDEAATQNGQDKKLAFLNAAVDDKIYSPQHLQTPVSPYQVMAGTIIPAAMVTGLNSDLPGQAIASVTEPVYDTVTGRTLLIPQGSRLLGTYDAQVSYGQSRVLLVWTRLIMPDGSSIVLDRLPGADTKGFAGLEDETDEHWGKLLAGAALSTLLGVGAELGSQQSGLGGTGQQTVVVATSRSAEDSLNQVGQQITRRNLNVQPTLTVRPGFPVRVIVNRDIVLRPYGATAKAEGPKP